MPARLRVHFSRQPVRSFPLDEGREYLIGRGDDCALALDDPRVSRHHARLFSREGEGVARWEIRDLGSKNGLSVGGLPADGPAVLGESVWISIGGLPAHFEVLSAERQGAEARRELNRWHTSLALQRRIDPAAGLESLLGQTLASVLELTDAERGFILLNRVEGGLEVAAARGPDRTDEPGAADRERAFAGSSAAVEQALAHGRPVTLCDASLDEILGRQPSVVEHEIRALVCLPLKVLDRTIGVLYGDSRQPGSAFTELDVEILAAHAAHAALAIAVARLHREVASVGEVLPAQPSAPARDLAAAWERSLPTQRVGVSPAAVPETLWRPAPAGQSGYLEESRRESDEL